MPIISSKEFPKGICDIQHLLKELITFRTIYSSMQKKGVPKFLPFCFLNFFASSNTFDSIETNPMVIKEIVSEITVEEKIRKLGLYINPENAVFLI
jgi:hypothetical protein